VEFRQLNFDNFRSFAGLLFPPGIPRVDLIEHKRIFNAPLAERREFRGRSKTAINCGFISRLTSVPFSRSFSVIKRARSDVASRRVAALYFSRARALRLRMERAPHCAEERNRRERPLFSSGALDLAEALRATD